MSKMQQKWMQKEKKENAATIRILKDGREICNLITKEGRDEYMRRLRKMWERQSRHCCLEGYIKNCPGKLRLADAVFEHQDGRGYDAGHRDDRIERFNRETGKMEPYNGAAHAMCNIRKGSVRINYHEVRKDEPKPAGQD